MNDAQSNNSGSDSNSFAVPATGDTLVLPWQHVVAVSAGVLVALLVLGLSLYCTWEVFRYLQIFSLDADPDKPLLSQLDQTQLVEIVAVAMALLIAAVYLGVSTKRQLETQFTLHESSRNRRLELESQVAELRQAVKESGKSAATKT